MRKKITLENTRLRALKLAKCRPKRKPLHLYLLGLNALQIDSSDIRKQDSKSNGLSSRDKKKY